MTRFKTQQHQYRQNLAAPPLPQLHLQFVFRHNRLEILSLNLQLPLFGLEIQQRSHHDLAALPPPQRHLQYFSCGIMTPILDLRLMCVFTKAQDSTTAASESSSTYSP